MELWTAGNILVWNMLETLLLYLTPLIWNMIWNITNHLVRFPIPLLKSGGDPVYQPSARIPSRRKLFFVNSYHYSKLYYLCPCTSNTLKTSIKIWPKADIADMEAFHLGIRKLILQMIEKKIVSMLGQNISIMFIELCSLFCSNILPWT